MTKEPENIIVKTVFGSHLYGTDSKKSDKDFAIVYMPSFEDIILGKAYKSYNISTGNEVTKNTREDVDTIVFSFPKFVMELAKGKMDTLDIFFSPEACILQKTLLWRILKNQKDMFISKNTQAFVSYARTQASKYGIKGSRLDTLGKVIEFLKSNRQKSMRDIWYNLPISEWSFYIEDSPNGVKQFKVCDRIIQSTLPTEKAIELLSRIYENYGHRAIQAKENKGIDWKAVSHAVRAAMEMKELVLNNTITFPLKEAVLLKKIKAGKLDYTTVVAPLLETLSDELHAVTVKSSLPDKVDMNKVNMFLVKTMRRIFEKKS